MMQELAVQEAAKDTVQQAQQEHQDKDLMAVKVEGQVQTDIQQAVAVAQVLLVGIGRRLSRAMAA